MTDREMLELLLVAKAFELFALLIITVTVAVSHWLQVSRDREIRALLQVVKGWAESARGAAKDVKETVKDVPLAEQHVIAAVERVPEKVVEKLKPNGSGQYSTVDPSVK